MKKALLFIFIISSFAAFSQNWAPINSTEKFCYSSDDTLDIINNVLWVDSFEQNGDNQVFHLNKIAKPVENQNFAYLFNEPQFLLDDIIIQPNGEWVCEDTFFTPLDDIQSFSIFPNAQLNDSWVFMNGIEAVISNVGILEIFGETDSVKTIALSDNSEIILSKNYGIINWKNQYQLVGIEGRNLGTLVPDFDDMYAHVSAGDVACIFRGEWQADETVTGWWEKTRLDIENVDKYEDSIVIVADVHSIFYQYWKGTEEITKSTQTIIKYRNRHTDIYPNDTMVIKDMYWPVDESWVISKLNYHEWGGLKKTQVIFEFDESMESTALYPCEGLYSFELCIGNWYSDYVLVEHSNYFGFLEFYDAGFEWGASDRLVGYIDDGVEYGDIYPLDMFVGTNQLSGSNSNWHIYPNPVQEDLYIKSSQSGLMNWSIFNISGQIMTQGTLEKTKEDIKLSVKDLPKGIFILQIEQDGEVSREKFFKTE